MIRNQSPFFSWGLTRPETLTYIKERRLKEVIKGLEREGESFCPDSLPCPWVPRLTIPEARHAIALHEDVCEDG